VIRTDPDVRAGLVAALGAYLIWGFLPLYFNALGAASPALILAHRILWACPTAMAAIMVSGKFREALQALRDRRMLLALLLSGLALSINWTLYIWAVTNGRVLEGSLGYFINPLVSFLFAALFFSERFNRLQVLALAAAGLGVLNQAVIVGRFPWIALSLGVTFALYGLIRKKTAIDPRIGFAIEALWLAPAALVGLAVLSRSGEAVFLSGSASDIGLLVVAGPITAVPLILFAAGARRLRLSTIALMQYIAPSIQFATGLALGEPFSAGQAATFGLIWAGAALFWQAARTAETQAQRQE
jgi:chloramphenicol-sensitive protein RarD